MKRILFFLSIVLIAIAGMLYFLTLEKDKVFISNAFPDFFPQEMIKEPYLVNLETVSGASKIPGERERVSISYTSYRSIEENIKSFNDYFKANDYSGTEQPKSDIAKFLAASKEKTSISVSIWKELPVRVSILYIISE